MVPIQERVSVVNLFEHGVHLEELRASGISVPQEEVMEPVRHDRVLTVHESSNRLKHRFEVVLFRSSAKYDVEMRILFRVPVVHVELVPELNGSVGEGPNQTNYSDQSSVRMLSNFSALQTFEPKFRKFR